MWEFLMTYEFTARSLIKMDIDGEFLPIDIQDPEVIDLWELERLEEEAFEASINAAIDVALKEEEKAEA